MILDKLADNGTAALRRVLPFAKPSDVRSPAGRVHRFGKPPSRCTKAHALGCDWAGFRTSGNVLLKCGLLHLKFLLKTARSKKCFPLTKLIKKWRRKHFLRLNFTKSSTQEPSVPHFSNTMLCDVAIFHNFLFS